LITRPADSRSLAVIGSAAALVPADDARRLARTVLAEGRFHQPSVPRPLHGVLRAIGEALRAPVRVLNDAVVALGALFPGGVAVVWILLAILVLAVALVLAARRSRQTLTSADGRREARPGEVVERASDLIRAAENAERTGQLAEAVRLRFRAGLLRLAERGSIGSPRSTPTTEVSRILGSAEFDELAHHFDEIVYGGSPPVSADVDAARREWPAVLRGSERA
jgi:Domain of unknown function (DUF4129)